MSRIKAIRHSKAATVGSLAVVLAATAGCHTPTASPAPTPALDDLVIAVEDSGAHYDRDQWPHWDSVGKGCDTRKVVLKERGADPVVHSKGCKIPTGKWISTYDNATTCPAAGGEWVADPVEGCQFTRSEDLDLDHIVPLAEAARSGARNWTEDQRREYANDIAGLTLTSASSNRSKGDQDPANWLPHHDQCGYLRHWLAVKTKYQLSVDQAEHDAIAQGMSQCTSASRDR